jgi:hypothetical protein
MQHLNDLMHQTIFLSVNVFQFSRFSMERYRIITSHKIQVFDETGVPVSPVRISETVRSIVPSKG